MVPPIYYFMQPYIHTAQKSADTKLDSFLRDIETIGVHKPRKAPPPAAPSKKSDADVRILSVDKTKSFMFFDLVDFFRISFPLGGRMRGKTQRREKKSGNEPGDVGNGR